MHRFLMRCALLAMVAGTPGAAGCFGTKPGKPTPDIAPPSAEEDRLLTVRSNYWTPVEIVLIGDGVRRTIGTVERQQPRTFRIPAYLVASGARVSLDARDPAASTSYSTGLFALAAGDAVELQLEHTLTLSTFSIRRR